MVVPALRRIARGRPRRVPFVQQLEAADCGAACLAMVAALHGKRISLDEARAATGSNRGTDALSIVNGATRFGLRGRGVHIELDALRFLPVGAILHWGLRHFVVLERVARSSIDIVDPAFGRRRVPIETFRKQFTGIALVFEPSESFEPTPQGRSKAWRYLRQLSAQSSLLGYVLVTSVALRFLALALPLLTAMVIDRVVPRGDEHMLMVVGAGTVAVLAFQTLSTLIRAHLLIELRTRMDTRMTLGFMTHLMRLPFAYFTRRSSGDLMLRVHSNTHIRELLTSSLLSTLLDGGLAVVYLVFLLVLSPVLALVTAVLGFAQVLVLLLARRRYAELASQDLESQARAQSYLVQMLVGIETLKVGGLEDRALDHWANLYVDELNIALSRSRLQAAVDTLQSLLQHAAPLALLGTGAMRVIDGGMSLGAMLAGIALATGFLTPLSTLVQTVMQLQMLSSYVDRTDDVLATDPEQRGSATELPLRLSGGIELRDVSFRYSSNEPMVLREVSATIAPGSTVAIVGRTGSGKSTLAALLLGLHRPTEGRIFYDGYDLAELDQRSLRQQLGVVPQNPFIFSGSIRSNIALGHPGLPYERVIAAARAARIDDDIRSMPMGYETIVADGGTTLSGGQRQRIALARALLRDPSVLLLDEATSSLDATTERQIMENLRELRSTRIVIAHRLSTIIGADQILVVDAGRIVERGRHDELFAMGGTYAALVRDQTSGGLS